MARRKSKPGKQGAVKARLFQLIFDLFLCFLVFTILPVLVFSALDPPTTPLMWIRWAESGYEKDFPRAIRRWRSIDEISPALVRAVIASEDQKFFMHSGFDWEAIKYAVKVKLDTDRTIGASTISMQTARNVFLWQGRNWLRKGLEAWFTFLIEGFWSKQRILEVYFNVIEWGDGVFGCEAASMNYFKHVAPRISPVESAWLAAVLPNPRVWPERKYRKLVEKRQARILNIMPKIRLPDFDQ